MCLVLVEGRTMEATTHPSRSVAREPAAQAIIVFALCAAVQSWWL
jgi:hypothetical protein